MTTRQEVVTEIRPPGGVAVGDDGSPAADVPALAQLEATTREDLHDRVDRVLGHPEDVKVHIHTVYAPAARTLISASESADVVVVGSRGLGGFASLLRSVADQCTGHCVSPVIVVRHPERTAAGEEEASS